MNTKKKVLVFSLDRDLAWSLAMLLDQQFDMVCETKLETLMDRITVSTPELLLIDMPLYGSDVLNVVGRIRSRWRSIPILMLRDYRKAAQASEEQIHNLVNRQLFKPMDVEMVAGAIDQLISSVSTTYVSSMQNE